MKTLLFLSLIIGMSFAACQTLNVSDFNNGTLNMSAECITILSDNATQTIYAPKYNLVLDVNPGQSKTNNETNITALGNSVFQNQIFMVNSTQNITDSVSNNTYVWKYETPPANYCYANEVKSIVSGQTSYYSRFNLTHICGYVEENINRSLNGNDTYYNPNTKVYLTGNTTRPMLNENIIVDTCGFSRDYPELNGSVSSSICEDKTEALDYGAVGSCGFTKKKFSAPAKIADLFDLTDGENKVCSSGEKVTCGIGIDDYLEYYSKLKSSEELDYWTIRNETDETCTTFATKCMDNITDKFTLEEKFVNPWGFQSGLDRLATQAQETDLQCARDLNTTTIDRDLCEKDKQQKVVNDTAKVKEEEQRNETLLYGGAVVIGFLALFAALYTYITHKIKQNKTQ